MEQMHRGAVEKPGFRWVCAEVPACSAYGMGWKTAIYRGMRFVFHTGEIEGYGSIQYLDFDKYGNWVKAKIQDTFLRPDEYGEYSDFSKEHSTNIVTRKITYYKQGK